MIRFWSVKPRSVKGSKSLLFGVSFDWYIAVPDEVSCSGVKYVICKLFQQHDHNDEGG